jgi:hypothetical protein
LRKSNRNKKRGTYQQVTTSFPSKNEVKQVQTVRLTPFFYYLLFTFLYQKEMKLPAKETIAQALPVSHLSFSSMKTYCQDQQAFYRGYILGERDDFETKPSFVI